MPWARPAAQTNRSRLFKYFAVVAPRLAAPAAERAADRLLDAMAKTTDYGALEKMSEGFAVVAARPAAPAAEQVADRLLDAMAKTCFYGALEGQFAGFAVVAPRLAAPAAERSRRPNPRQYSQDQQLSALARFPSALRRRCRGWPPRPPSGRPVDRLLDAWPRPAIVAVTGASCRGFRGGASRLPAPAAERVADRILDAMEAETSAQKP